MSNIYFFGPPPDFVVSDLTQRLVKERAEDMHLGQLCRIFASDHDQVSVKVDDLVVQPLSWTKRLDVLLHDWNVERLDNLAISRCQSGSNLENRGNDIVNFGARYAIKCAIRPCPRRVTYPPLVVA